MGVKKITHNFFAQYPDTGFAPTSSCIYLNEIGGYYEIYDNIIVYNGSDGAMLEFLAQNWDTTPTTHIYAKVYNDTFWSTQTATQVCKFYGVDSLRFKNNLIYKANGSDPMFISGGIQNNYLDVD